MKIFSKKQIKKAILKQFITDEVNLIDFIKRHSKNIVFHCYLSNGIDFKAIEKVISYKTFFKNVIVKDDGCVYLLIDENQVLKQYKLMYIISSYEVEGAIKDFNASDMIFVHSLIPKEILDNVLYESEKEVTETERLIDLINMHKGVPTKENILNISIDIYHKNSELSLIEFGTHKNIASGSNQMMNKITLSVKDRYGKEIYNVKVEYKV